MSSIIKNAALAATALLAVSANCHMIMRTPTPYGKSTLNNSPLEASGSDFPCKQRPGVYDAEGAQNIMAIGEPQTLSFTGSAVHGGGSCQVALTTDLQPTKDSKWMVIKSIEGGCPSNAPGNLPEDPNGSGASTFQYTIPEGIAPGEYTISWSWHNKIGNREMYQNCGPATVVGAKKRRYAPPLKASKRQTSFPDLFVANLASINSCTTPESFEPSVSEGCFQKRTAEEVSEEVKGDIEKRGLNQLHKRTEFSEEVKRDIEKRANLPDLFVANLASINDCVTEESKDYIYPNPGPDVEQAGTGPYMTLSCGASGGGSGGNSPQQPPTTGTAPQNPGNTLTGPGQGNPTGQPQGPGNQGQPTSAAPGAVNPTGQPQGPPQGPGNPATSSQPLDVVPVTFASNPAGPTTFATETRRPGAPGVFVTTATDGPATTSIPKAAPQNSSEGSQSGPCTVEGQWFCAATGSSFQRCSSGQWSVPMAMAVGMKCEPGMSADISMSPSRVKRHAHGLLHLSH